jgi:hypothetical protein
VELASAPLELLSGLIRPKVELVRDRAGNIAKRPEEVVREVFQPEVAADEAAAPATATPAEKIALLERALDRYRAVIEYQQRQISGQQKQRQTQDDLIKSLRSEMESLQRQLDGGKAK